MTVQGGKLVARNITKFGGGFLRHVNSVMNKAREILDRKVTENMSLSDHSLEDLRIMDHPYATRHGSRGRPIHSPYWLVHTQGGRLLSSKSSGIDKASLTGGELTARAWVKLDESAAHYAVYVVWGTSKMIPRDFLGGSLEQEKEKILGVIQGNLRDAVVSFRGEVK